MIMLILLGGSMFSGVFIASGGVFLVEELIREIKPAQLGDSCVIYGD